MFHIDHTTKMKFLKFSVNFVTQIFGRFVGLVRLEISRCQSESILINVSDIIAYIMRIMGFDFKKIRSSSFRDKQKNAESQDLE